MTRYRPSKPAAVLGLFVGIGMIIFALTSMDGTNNPAFMVFWCAVVVGITGLNLWAAFSPRGSTYESEDSR